MSVGVYVRWRLDLSCQYLAESGSRLLLFSVFPLFVFIPGISITESSVSDRRIWQFLISHKSILAVIGLELWQWGKRLAAAGGGG